MPRLALLYAAAFLTAAFASAASDGRPGDEGPPKVSFPRTARKQAGVALKRRHEWTDEQLRQQLVRVPEVGFNQDAAALIYKPLRDKAGELKQLPPDLGPRQFLLLTQQLRQPQQFALPWRTEPGCSMGKEAADRLHVLSLHLRDCLMKSTPQGDVRPDPRKVKALLAKDEAKAREYKTPHAIPTLMQLLQAETGPIRLLLVELLADIPGKEASAALAQRALFDLSAEVREKAAQALAKRPAREYQHVLVEGLRYPWPAVADHAAEAVVALRLKGLVPDLVKLLREPDPTRPVKLATPAPARPAKKNKIPAYAVKELVRINHLCNCVLCHPPSLAKDDLIRGRIPIPGEDPPPLYYNATSGLFVRANTTYLRQDFSVVQPVENNGKWAAFQRYDYVVRVRPLSAPEAKRFGQLEEKGLLPKTYPQRDSVLFALRQLTNADAGGSYEAWAAELPNLIEAPKEEKK